MEKNKLSVKGNLVDVPEIKALSNGSKVAKATLGINNRYKNKAGEEVDEVSFVDVEAYGEKAEVLEQNGTKGKWMQVDGKLVQDRWKDEEGKTHSKLKILAFDVKPVDIAAEKEEGKKFSNNSVSIEGNLVAKPTVKELPSGGKTASCSVAVNDIYTDKKNNKVNNVSYFDIEAFGDKAEFLEKNGDKGFHVKLDGKIKQDRWKDEEGKTHSKIKIIPFEMSVSQTKKLEKKAPNKDKDDDCGYGR